MSTISLRLPDSLHKQVRKLAEQESVSINQLVTLALAEKLSALITEDYLCKRAERGNRKRFDRAMRRVPKVKPEEHDRLPASSRVSFEG
jgi:predicted transcriptional regulator